MLWPVSSSVLMPITNPIIAKRPFQASAKATKPNRGVSDIWATNKQFKNFSRRQWIGLFRLWGRNGLPVIASGAMRALDQRKAPCFENTALLDPLDRLSEVWQNVASWHSARSRRQLPPQNCRQAPGSRCRRSGHPSDFLFETRQIRPQCHKTAWGNCSFVCRCWSHTWRHYPCVGGFPCWLSSLFFVHF